MAVRLGAQEGKTTAAVRVTETARAHLNPAVAPLASVCLRCDGRSCVQYEGELCLIYNRNINLEICVNVKIIIKIKVR